MLRSGFDGLVIVPNGKLHYNAKYARIDYLLKANQEILVMFTKFLHLFSDKLLDYKSHYFALTYLLEIVKGYCQEKVDVSNLRVYQL